MFGGKNSMNWKWEIDNNTFDLVNVSQFKNTHCSTIFALFLAIGQVILTIVLYASDCYTCVRLLAYNSWASEIEPSIPFRISRWIFSGCILLSIVLLIYEWIYGVKVYFTRNISLTYTNSVAKMLWSLKGYSYFCLYDQITPKNFFDYCGFFIYFTLKDCVKLLFADSPRQVINGLTIYSVVRNDRDKVVSSFEHLRTDGVKETWAIVFTIMGLSFVIWLIFIIKFFVAVLLSCCVVTKINQEGYVLKQFVCVRINERVRELTSKYHKESLKQLKEENSRLGLKPTLPVLPGNNEDDDTLFSKNGLDRKGTITEKFSKMRRSLRRSGNDLLPLNKHAAAPPPLPAYSSDPSLRQKDSSMTLNQQPRQEQMSPIYNTGYPQYQPQRDLTNNIPFNNFQKPNRVYQQTNPSSEFASSRDNLLDSDNFLAGPRATQPIQPIRDMPRPHLDGQLYSNPQAPYNERMLTGNTTGFGTSTNYTGGTLVNNSAANTDYTGGTLVNNPLPSSLANANSAPYPTTRRQLTGGNDFISNNDFTGSTDSFHTGLNDNSQLPYHQTGNSSLPRNHTGNSLYSLPKANTGGSQYSNGLPRTNTGGSGYIKPNHTASGFGNSTSPPYPSDNSRDFSPVSIGDTSSSSFSGFSTPQIRSNNTGFSNGSPTGSFNNLPMIMEQSTGSSTIVPTNRQRVPANLPYPNARLNNSIANNNSLNTNLSVDQTSNHGGIVSPNSRLLLINNLYGGEADNGDTGVSPILPTYKDMGLEEYLGKKR